MVSVVNLKVNRVAELLARYIDRKLRGEKGMQENDTEQSFDKVRHLILYLNQVIFSVKQWVIYSATGHIFI